MRLAFCSNAFHTMIKHVQAVERMRSCAERMRSDKESVTFYVTGTVYDIPASLNLIILSFSSIFDTTFLHLDFFVTLRTSLSFHLIDNATTAHGNQAKAVLINRGFIHV